MVGNAAEEGLMLQIDNPSHLDRGRIAVPAAAITMAATFVAVGAVLPVLGTWLTLLVAFGVGSWVGVWLYRRLRARDLRKSAEAMAAARETRAAVKRRQMRPS